MVASRSNPEFSRSREIMNYGALAIGSFAVVVAASVVMLVSLSVAPAYALLGVASLTVFATSVIVAALFYSGKG